MFGEKPEIKVGTYVKPEDWSFGSCLKPGLKGFCDFYLPVNSAGPIKELAVNVEVTGRMPRRVMSGYYWRAKVTFVGDGEPNVAVGGWVPA